MSHDHNAEGHYENGMLLANSRELSGLNKTYLLTSSTYSLLMFNQSVKQSVS